MDPELPASHQILPKHAATGFQSARFRVPDPFGKKMKWGGKWVTLFFYGIRSPGALREWPSPNRLNEAGFLNRPVPRDQDELVLDRRGNDQTIKGIGWGEGNSYGKCGNFHGDRQRPHAGDHSLQEDNRREGGLNSLLLQQ